MPSAVAFFPPYMRVFVNLETSLSLYFGSGVILRFGTSRRRGIAQRLLETVGWSGIPPTENLAFGRFTPYFERLRFRFTLFVEDGPIAPEASSVPRMTW